MIFTRSGSLSQNANSSSRTFPLRPARPWTSRGVRTPAAPTRVIFMIVLRPPPRFPVKVLRRGPQFVLDVSHVHVSEASSSTSSACPLSELQKILRRPSWRAHRIHFPLGDTPRAATPQDTREENHHRKRRLILSHPSRGRESISCARFFRHERPKSRPGQV